MRDQHLQHEIKSKFELRKDRLSTSIATNSNSISQLETDVERIDNSLTQDLFTTFKFNFLSFL